MKIQKLSKPTFINYNSSPSLPLEFLSINFQAPILPLIHNMPFSDLSKLISKMRSPKLLSQKNAVDLLGYLLEKWAKKSSFKQLSPVFQALTGHQFVRSWLISALKAHKLSLRLGLAAFMQCLISGVDSCEWIQCLIVSKQSQLQECKQQLQSLRGYLEGERKMLSALQDAGQEQQEQQQQTKVILF